MPLDVAFAWFVHRQDPERYTADCKALGVTSPHAASSQAFAFGCERSDAQRAWRKCFEQHPQPECLHPAWPPPAPGSAWDLTRTMAARKPRVAPRLAECMQRMCGLLHSWLRPQYLQEAFLQQAEKRYSRFLELHAWHPTTPLVPTADIALLWHTHLGLSGEWARRSKLMFGTSPGKPWGPQYLSMRGGELAEAYAETARLYEKLYGERYDGPDTAWVPLQVQHPLAAPAGPLARVLATFSQPLPQHQAALREAEQAAAAQGADLLRFKPHNGSLRSGAHALLAAWTVAQATEAARWRASGFCCFKPSKKAVRKAASRLAARRLAGLRFFYGVPASSAHPYLLAVRHVAGRRREGPSGGAPATAAAQTRKHRRKRAGRSCDDDGVPDGQAAAECTDDLACASRGGSCTSSSGGSSSHCRPRHSHEGGEGPAGASPHKEAEAQQREGCGAERADPANPQPGHARAPEPSNGAQLEAAYFFTPFWYLGSGATAPATLQPPSGAELLPHPGAAAGFLDPAAVEAYLPDLQGVGALLGGAAGGAEAVAADAWAEGVGVLADPDFRQDLEGGYDRADAAAVAAGDVQWRAGSFSAGSGGGGGWSSGGGDGGGGGGWFDAVFSGGGGGGGGSSCGGGGGGSSCGGGGGGGSSCGGGGGGGGGGD